MVSISEPDSSVSGTQTRSAWQQLAKNENELSSTGSARTSGGTLFQVIALLDTVWRSPLYRRTYPLPHIRSRLATSPDVGGVAKSGRRHKRVDADPYLTRRKKIFRKVRKGASAGLMSLRRGPEPVSNNSWHLTCSDTEGTENEVPYSSGTGTPAWKCAERWSLLEVLQRCQSDRFLPQRGVEHRVVCSRS